MSRKQTPPPLPPPEPIPAPDHLSDRSKALWRGVVPSRAKSAARLALVATALEALDRANECREAIAKEGMTSRTETTGALHVHPLVKVEAEARRQFAAIWRSLDLQCDRRVDSNFGSASAAEARLNAMLD